MLPEMKVEGVSAAGVAVGRADPAPVVVVLSPHLAQLQHPPCEGYDADMQIQHRRRWVR